MITGGPEYAAEGPVVGECRSMFSPDYAPEEIYEIAAKLMRSGGISPLQPGDGIHSRFQGSVAGSPGASDQVGRDNSPTPARAAKTARSKGHK